MDTIRWQSLAARFMNEEAVKKLDPSLQQFEELLTEVISTAEEAVQIVDVNLLAATESTLNENATDDDTDKKQTPLSISLEGLERAISSLEKGIKEIRKKNNVYKEIAETRLPTALDMLAGTMLRRDFDRFELQDKAFLVKEQALNWKQKISAKLAHISEKLELGWRFGVLKFNQYSRIVKPYLGIQKDVAISTKEKRNLAEYLARPSVPTDLPFVYKRLFNRDFSIDDRFYVSPANSFKMIGDSYDQWSRGISSNVAVIGEKGSGKSTLIRFAEQQYLKDVSTVTVTLKETFTEEEVLLKKLCDALGFKPVSTKEEFIEKVERKKNRSVIVIENIQNIFIRNINGFDALEAFWIIMSSTMDKLFWIVSCSRYSWEFFIKISEADQYFSHVAYTDRLDETEIREAILTRHKSSGYELYFEPDETLKHSRAFKKLLGDEKKSQELVRDQFFSKLSKICEGNTSIAMIFWLQSIKEINSHRFVFQPLEITELDRLEVPSKEVLFTLTALIQHDSLNEQQLALALHQNPSESRLMLARLKTKGIIYAGSNGYHLNHLVYRQVVRILKQRNIIH
jgi:energy-coupling factor transporter ATP-binding protein EcfA2